MGACQKPDNVKCPGIVCQDCKYHELNILLNKLESEALSPLHNEIGKQLDKLRKSIEQDYKILPGVNIAKVVPLVESKDKDSCSHETILVSEYGYICYDCRKQMKLVDGKFVLM
jgi:hypothetical protein